MYIEPNCNDRFIIWDNILTLQQKRSILNTVCGDYLKTNYATKRHLSLQRTNEMSNDSKSLVLQAMAIYRKSGYFENKVYPKYVKFVKKQTDMLTHYEFLEAVIPQWLLHHETMIRDKLDSGQLSNGQLFTSSTMRSVEVHIIPVDLKTYEGRIAFEACNSIANDGSGDQLDVYSSELGRRNLECTYEVKHDCMSTRNLVDSHLTTSKLGTGMLLMKNTLFDYSEELDDICPNMDHNVDFDGFPTWLQYMLLTDPTPLVKKTIGIGQERSVSPQLHLSAKNRSQKNVPRRYIAIK